MTISREGFEVEGGLGPMCLGSQVSRFVVALILGAVLGGCASAVGWGQKYEVVHKNSRSITVKYDSILADFKTFAQEVDCAQYGKEAVPEGRKDTQANTIWGGVQTVTFRCE